MEGGGEGSFSCLTIIYLDKVKGGANLALGIPNDCQCCCGLNYIKISGKWGKKNPVVVARGVHLPMELDSYIFHLFISAENSYY